MDTDQYCSSEFRPTWQAAREKGSIALHLQIIRKQFFGTYNTRIHRSYRDSRCSYKQPLCFSFSECGLTWNFLWTEPTKPWTSMPPKLSVEEQELFRLCTTITVGNGAKNQFWKDRWLQGRPRWTLPRIASAWPGARTFLSSRRCSTGNGCEASDASPSLYIILWTFGEDCSKFDWVTLKTQSHGI